MPVILEGGDLSFTTLEGFNFSGNVGEACEIGADLVEEAKAHPGKLANLGVIAALKRAEARRKKRNITTVSSTRYIQLRQELEEAAAAEKGKGPTEATITANVNQDHKLIEAQEQAEAADLEADLADVVYKSFFERRALLVELLKHEMIYDTGGSEIDPSKVLAEKRERKAKAGK